MVMSFISDGNESPQQGHALHLGYSQELGFFEQPFAGLCLLMKPDMHYQAFVFSKGSS
jgi:hypothetical protein